MKQVLALGLLLAATAPAAAVSTTVQPLTTVNWVDLGVGPMQIQTNNQSQVLYQIADAAPAAGAGGFALQGISPPQTISTTSHVYVRLRSAVSVTGATVGAFVVYAPVR